MQYLGINNAEDYIYYMIRKFEENNVNRKIHKILTPPSVYADLQRLADSYTIHNTPLIEMCPVLEFNGVPIERSFHIKTITLVPEGSLAAVLYE